MFYIEKTIEIAAAHQHKGTVKCGNLHGHNYNITIYCKSDELDEYGFVVDFCILKSLINDKMDHKFLNDVFDFSPTAENIAKWIVDNVPKCYKAKVSETSNNIAIYEKD
jgi:6-pyruvoyltetrahydropterin/6-carboxytetrahydropterin synthase